MSSSSQTPWNPTVTTANVDHDDKRPDILAALFTTWAIAAICVFLRLWTRARIVRKLGFSDLLVALSLIVAGAMCGVMVYEVENGMGQHYYDIVNFDAKFPHLMKGFWLSLLFYIVSLALTKVSICMLYLTIFTLEWARRGAYAVLFLVVIHNLWATVTTFTFCIPLHAAWTFMPEEEKWCQPKQAWWVNTGLTILTDFLIFLLPIPIIGPLNLPKRQKIVVIVIFTLGFFICVVSCTRVVILFKFETSKDLDTTYNNTSLNHLTVLEVHTAIVVACLMTLKPLVGRLWPDLLTPRNTTGTETGTGPSSVRVGGRRTDLEGGGGGGGGGANQLTIGSTPVRGRMDWMMMRGKGGTGTGTVKTKTRGGTINDGDVALDDFGVAAAAEAEAEVETKQQLGQDRIIERNPRGEDDHGEEEGGGGGGGGEKGLSGDGIGDLHKPPPPPGPNASTFQFQGKGDAASVRTEQELGPEVCARSFR